MFLSPRSCDGSDFRPLKALRKGRRARELVVESESEHSRALGELTCVPQLLLSVLKEKKHGTKAEIQVDANDL